MQPLVLLPFRRRTPRVRRLPRTPSLRRPAHDQLTLTKATFADLPGWTDDHPAEAVPSFLSSCARIAELADAAPVGADGHGGIAKQWRHACAAAARLKPATTPPPVRSSRPSSRRGSPRARPARWASSPATTSRRCTRAEDQARRVQVPGLGRPADLVEVDLTPFIRDAHARRIWGRLDAHRLGRAVLHARGDPQGRARRARGSSCCTSTIRSISCSRRSRARRR